MALATKREAGTEATGVAPWNVGAECDAIHPGDFIDAANDLPIKVDDLIRSLSIRHDRYVHGEYAMHIEPGLCCLQRKQRLDEHAGSRQQHEGRGDLRDREDLQSTAGAPGDAHSATSQPESLG